MLCLRAIFGLRLGIDLPEHFEHKRQIIRRVDQLIPPKVFFSAAKHLNGSIYIWNLDPIDRLPTTRP